MPKDTFGRAAEAVCTLCLSQFERPISHEPIDAVVKLRFATAPRERCAARAEVDKYGLDDWTIRVFVVENGEGGFPRDRVAMEALRSIATAVKPPDPKVDVGAMPLTHFGM